MEYAITTDKLTKYYGKSRGIIDVDLNVVQGEIFGFIGPNGAGKSTTIRTLLGLLNKTSGTAEIFGFDCEKDKVKILKDVGYLPSEVFYYDNMKAADLFKYSASFYNKDCTERIKELSDILEIDTNRKIEDMSLGNKKKVGIVQGLLHSPKLIILDEPTSGLDPLMQRTFFELIKHENERGATVLFSSHILSEVQRICDRVAIIKEGRIISTESIESIRANAYKHVRVTLKTHLDNFKLNGAKDINIYANNLSFMFKGDANELINALADLPIENLDITEPELEEIFLHYYEGGTI